MTNLLVNPGFEELWGGSRRCVVVWGSELAVVDIWNMQCPKGWAVWLVQGGLFDGPEGRMNGSRDPDRMKSGLSGYMLFKTNRQHHSGLMQKVVVGKGRRVALTGWAHAWSNHYDPELPEKFPHPNDPMWSEGAGYKPFYGLEGGVQDDALRNFTFWLGLDPLGGIDPFAESVVWGAGAHIYNVFHGVPPVSVVAEADEVTVFCRNMAIWPYKHNDAYWDDFSLVVIDEPVECRGAPRTQFVSDYTVFPQDAKWADYAPLVRQLFAARKTQGFSWDRAGLGDLDDKTAVIIDHRDEQEAIDWFAEYYPGTKVENKKVKPDTPPEPPGPEPQPKPNCVISLHRQTDESGIQNYLEKVQPEWIKVVNGVEDAAKYKAWGAKNVDVRIPVGNSKQYIDSMDIEGYLANFDQALERNIDHIDAFEDLNEEWPNDPKVLEFLIRMSNEAKRRYGSDLKLCSGNWAVGNGEGAWLLDWARVIAANGHLAGYHCYHPVSPQWAEDWMEQEAQWYHLRHLYHLDPYFVANEVFVDWLGTEGGGVEGKPIEGPGVLGTHGYTVGAAPRVARLSDEFIAAKAIERLMLNVSVPSPEGFMRALVTGVGPLDPTGGWLSSDALNGDLPRYIRLQKRLEEKIDLWNMVNGNRMRGTAIFTVGARYTGWDQYKLWEREMDAFAEAFPA